MKKVMIFTGMSLLLTFFSCGPSASQKENQLIQDSLAVLNRSIISSSAAVNDNSDSTHKFIRTAHLKFRVNNVISSTYNIENIIRTNGGFVTYTKLNSDISREVTTEISPDSNLITTYYTVSNDIVLRVPNSLLDTTLKQIANNVAFLDYRVIKADDVALDILSNDLAIKRNSNNKKRLEQKLDNNPTAKISQTVNAEEKISDKQSRIDGAIISKLSMNDRIKFSTVNLSIYQRESIKREVLANSKNIDAYEPPFTEKLIESFAFGWGVFKGIILFVAKLWGIFVFLGIMVLIWYIPVWVRKQKRLSNQ